MEGRLLRLPEFALVFGSIGSQEAAAAAAATLWSDFFVFDVVLYVFGYGESNATAFWSGSTDAAAVAAEASAALGVLTDFTPQNSCFSGHRIKWNKFQSDLTLVPLRRSGFFVFDVVLYVFGYAESNATTFGVIRADSNVPSEIILMLNLHIQILREEPGQRTHQLYQFFSDTVTVGLRMKSKTVDVINLLTFTQNFEKKSWFPLKVWVSLGQDRLYWMARLWLDRREMIKDKPPVLEYT